MPGILPAPPPSLKWEKQLRSGLLCRLWPTFTSMWSWQEAQSKTGALYRPNDFNDSSYTFLAPYLYLRRYSRKRDRAARVFRASNSWSTGCEFDSRPCTPGSVHGRVTVFGMSVCNRSPRSTQPSIPPEWVNRVHVPACLAGVRVGRVHLWRVARNTV